LSVQSPQQRSPAALFVALWRDASEWPGPQRAGAKRQPARFDVAARHALLRNHRPEAAYDALSAMIGPGCRSDADFRGQSLAVMRAIDEAYYLVHPRGAQAAASSGVRVLLPNWLRDSRDQRLLSGVYALDHDLVLLPRGPLLRGARHVTASSADSLADRFAALSVAPSVLDQDGRKISLSLKVVSPAVARGIPPGLHTGAETIAFVPIAEAVDDIVGSARRDGDQVWIDFGPRSDLDASACIVVALAEAGVVDLAIAPEFMVSERHADVLADALTSSPANARLLIAGSGVTAGTFENQAWNEARALNGSGTEIWRQRKLWPAGIDKDRAQSFGIQPPAADSLAYEDTAAGDRLSIIDADGLGRCVILICQDLEAERLAPDVVSHFQPDWVFVPLLDTGVGHGRWMHRRAFELSARSQSRFVFVSSTSLAARAGYANPACALAVGPQMPTHNVDGDQDVPRAVQTAEATSKGEARFAVIKWREGRWLTSALSADGR
jgi:hypothetical protein